MIVPKHRLIILSAVVLLPASVLAARSPEWTPAAITATVILVIAALLDAGSGESRFTGIQVSAPAIIRMTVNRSVDIPLVLKKPLEAEISIRIGLSLPEAISINRNDQRTHMAAGHEKQQIAWPCVATRRGRYPLTVCIAEIPSRLGLWSIRREFMLNCEIRAYPNLLSGQKHIRGLFDRQEIGWHIMRKVGKGREFEQLREYLPGDSFEDIDWKATARHRHPITRTYQVEHSQEIYVILDASRLSTRDVHYMRDRRKQQRQFSDHGFSSIFERYITAALVMAVAAERAADRYGLLIFDDKPNCFVKAGRGIAHYNTCREILYDRMPRRVSPAFDELFTFIGTHVRKRAMLIFLTNLDDPLLSESFVNAMTIAANRHVLLVNMCRPPGAYPLFSSPDVHQVEDVYQHLVGHMLWSSLSDTRRKLQQYGAGFTLLEEDQLCSQLIGQYLEVKRRQTL
jgi:uncharacterized protein (DUF58 family)